MLLDVLRVVLAILALTTVYVVGRTLLFSWRQRAAEIVEGIPVDSPIVAEHLAAAVRCQTVPTDDHGTPDEEAFRHLHQGLKDTYHVVHEKLKREVVGGFGLLYTWPGSDPSLPPVVLMGHMDVVPVPEESLAKWSHPPFAGAVADGFVWGRGALDDKVTVLAILEAVEALLRDGARPTRTIYLAFGHDEEVSGRFGAKAMVDLLIARGVKPALVLDEGGAMAENLLPGVPGRSAIVGIAEKGYVSLTLTADAVGGHSSMPPPETAVGILSRAVVALEAHPFPLELDGPTRGMLEAMAPYVPFGQRIVLANLWLTGPLISRLMSGSLQR